MYTWIMLMNFEDFHLKQEPRISSMETICLFDYQM